MPRPGRVVLALIFILASPLAHAEPANPTVDKLLDFWQTEGFLDRAATDFQDAVARRRKDVVVTDAQAQALQGLGKRIYPGKNLLRVFKANYTRAITSSAVAALSAWTRTSNGMRLGNGLAAAYKIDAAARQQKFDADSAAFKANRKNVLHTFLIEWQHDDAYALMQAGLDFGVAMALNTIQPQAARETTKYLKEKAMSHRTGYLPDGRKAALTLDYNALAELKDEDIDELSRFAVTPPAQAHVKAFAKALEATLDGAAVTLARQMLKETAAK